MGVAVARMAEGEWEIPLPDGGPAEVRQLTEAFRAMAARLRSDFQRLRSDREHLQRLAAEVAHEMRTPTASLSTYLELLQSGDHPARADLLRRGLIQVARLEHLARFLSDMAQLEAHTAPLERSEEDLAAIVRQAADLMGPVARQHGVALRCETPEGPVPVLANPLRLGQALDNLLANALRFTPPGGTVTVTVAVAAGGGWAEVTVTDEGPGIPADLLPRLFEPFVRGPSSPGLGLGLAVVRAVARAHGGDVTAENLPEGGAAFRLRLPLPGERTVP